LVDEGIEEGDAKRDSNPRFETSHKGGKAGIGKVNVTGQGMKTRYRSGETLTRRWEAMDKAQRRGTGTKKGVGPNEGGINLEANRGKEKKLQNVKGRSGGGMGEKKGD